MQRIAQILLRDGILRIDLHRTDQYGCSLNVVALMHLGDAQIAQIIPA